MSFPPQRPSYIINLTQVKSPVVDLSSLPGRSADRGQPEKRQLCPTGTPIMPGGPSVTGRERVVREFRTHRVTLIRGLSTCTACQHVEVLITGQSEHRRKDRGREMWSTVPDKIIANMYLFIRLTAR